MPEKRHIFTLPALVHFHAVADRHPTQTAKFCTLDEFFLCCGSVLTLDSLPASVSCVVGGGAAVTPPLRRLALTSRTQTWVTPSAPLWLPRAASACPPRASTVRPGSRRRAGPGPGTPRAPQSK